MLHRLKPTGTWIYGLTSALMALPVLLVMLPPGLPLSSDGGLHLHRLVNAGTGIANGDLYPRWSYYLHHGFGYPLNNFYAPGAYLVGGGLWQITGLQAETVFKLLVILAGVLYPLGAHTFARTFAGRTGALLAAAAYTWMPLRAYELAVQLNLPQWIALALLPWVLWAIHRAATGNRRDMTLLALLFAALILTHHLTAFLFAPFAGIYALFHMRDRGRFLRLAGGFALGLALATIYWLPVFAELDTTQIDTIQDSRYSIETNFLPVDSLLRGSSPIDRSLLNWSYLGSSMTPRVGQVALGMIALSSLALLPVFKVSPGLRWHVAGGIITAAMCLFMITEASLPIWEALPLVGYVQFPWRLLGIVALAVIPAAAALPALIPARWRDSALWIGAALLLIAYLPLIYAPVPYQQALDLTPEDGIRHEMQTGNMGLTASNEYLPRWSQTRPQYGLTPDRFARFITGQWFVDLDAEALPHDTQVERLAPLQPRSSRYRVTLSAASEIQFMQLYFPGFIVTVDEQPADIFPSQPHGLIRVALAEGTHEISIWYAGTPIQNAATIITLAALIVTVGLWAVPIRTTQPVAVNVPDAHSPRLAGAMTAAILAFVGVNLLIIGPHTDLLRPASDPAAPPAQIASDIQFGDLIALRGYDIDRTQAYPGETVTVRLYWQLLEETDRSLRGSVQLVSRDGTQTWGNDTHFNLAAINTVTWPTDRYAIDVYRFKVAPDAPPYVGQIRVTVFTDEATLAPDNAPLADFRVLGDRRQHTDLIAIDARFGDIMTLEGYQLTAGDSELCANLRWHAQSDGTDDLTVLLHLLEADGAFIAAADAPPLNNQYPTSLWRAGQKLDDRHCFPYPDNAASLAVGLYRQSDLTRLPLVADRPTAANTLILPLTLSDEAAP